MRRVFAHVRERDLMRAPGAFGLMSIDLFGPVQPLGERSTIIGQRGRSALPLLRAAFWRVRISRMAASSVAAMVWCIVSGSSPSTK